nr:hypothetical protein Iba_chr07eCG0990 [Ipomoea batatas]
MANVAFLRHTASAAVVVPTLLAALGQDDVGGRRGGVRDVAVHLGFWDGEVGETTAERKLKRVGGDGRVFGGDEIKSAEVVDLADYSCRRSCGGATNLLPPKRKQNRGATGPYCRRKENRRKKRRRPLLPEVVAPLLPPEVHRHCRVADIEEEASKLL